MFNVKLTKQTIVRFYLLAAVILCVALSISAQINIGGFSIPKPKKSKPTSDQTENKTPKGADTGKQSNQAENVRPEDIQTNPNAPADYNSNLNIGDQAVAVDRFRDVEKVKILAKSGSAYKVTPLDSPDSGRWFSINSVYPYYDAKAFDEIMFEYKHYVAPYLPCYGKKHNLNEGKVTEEGYNAFGARHFDNAQDAQKTLQAEQPKLAELEGMLKSKFTNEPNTFLEYMHNPAMVAEIVSQRGEYMKCVVGEEDSKPDFRLSVFLDDIKKAQGEAERYTPADFLYLVSAGDASDELLRAISPRAREEWSKQWLKNADSRAEFNTEWDKLAAIAAKKLPTYKPDPASFKFHHPAGEKLLMGYFKNPSTLKIFRIGTDTAGWDIQKDSSGFPSYRYKDVRVYLRDSSDDHPFCKVVSARVKQDYAGGGTYNSEVYRSSTSEELYGCP